MKPKKVKVEKNLPLSTLNDKKQFFSELNMEETLPNKGILEKSNKRREELDLLYSHQQAETLNKP
jgi:hypothetical protein